MKINNNIQALNAYRNLNQNQFSTSKNLEKLSSGMRINRAADDAAGLAISEKMRSQIRGLKQAERNAMDGISLMQTAEGALAEVHSMLQRMRELAVQGANDTNTQYDREQIQKEIEQLKLEVDSISEKTEFNTRKLLNGSSAVLSSISEASNNGAYVVGSPRVIDPSLASGEYFVKVEDTEEVVRINQVGAGISDNKDIKLDPDQTKEFYPQAFGEYTINVRSVDKDQNNAVIQVIGPNGLPLDDRNVHIKEAGQEVSIGGLLINTKKINEAGTIKVSIEQEAKFSIYRGSEVSPETKITGEKVMTTRNGVIKHGGIEFTFDNRVSEGNGVVEAKAATVTISDLQATERKSAEIRKVDHESATGIVKEKLEGYVLFEGDSKGLVVNVARDYTNASTVQYEVKKNGSNYEITKDGDPNTTTTVAIEPAESYEKDGVKIDFSALKLEDEQSVEFKIIGDSDANTSKQSPTVDASNYTGNEEINWILTKTSDGFKLTDPENNIVVTPDEFGVYTTTNGIKIDASEINDAQENDQWFINIAPPTGNSSNNNLSSTGQGYYGETDATWNIEYSDKKFTLTKEVAGEVVETKTITPDENKIVSEEGLELNFSNINNPVNGDRWIIDVFAPDVSNGGNRGFGNIEIVGDGAGYTGTNATWEFTYDGDQYKLDRGNGFQTIELTGNHRFESDGVELDFSKIVPVNGDTWTVNLTAGITESQAESMSQKATKFSITNNALAFQIGPNTNQNVMIDVPRLDIVTLGIEEIDVTTQKGANEAIFALDQAINVLSDVRAKLGATQNRMEHTINNLQVTHENLTASESRIRDADMALEMTEFTKNNILNQAATAMLAQANQLPQGVLQLLQ